ncbi:hypothetical protein CAPTEDRAFT_197976 [Capitella teleta]|uniref:Immunoglobulin I-set domain-containing protein n=1 Tax=Capitella teleta TaxID=283909 RepID=R7UI79_CAPTE|nr:hypothetical protein CAPTEDRAFT_197976 [Capitella teleta]|eukprot:ELU02947.1 hypothetical protein CAPTEDRAFT_197976 [Capitella teleta]
MEGILTIFLTLLCFSSTAYVPVKKDKSLGKSNSIHRRLKPTGLLFKNDWVRVIDLLLPFGKIQLKKIKQMEMKIKADDIARYLKLYGVEMMLWRCKNAIQPEYNWQPLSFVDLYCEVIGRMKSVTWSHNGQEIKLDDINGKYGHVVIPHYANGHYYSRWIDFQLRIFNATESDGGLYSFRVNSMSGRSQQQIIYVDISDKRRKRDRELIHQV